MLVGVEQLGYLCFEVTDLAAWEHFGTQVLGMVVGERLPGGGFTLRMDGRKHRFVVTPGAADDCVAVGWQVADADALAAVAERLRAGGLDVALGSDADAAARSVAGLATLRDPAGLRLELFHGLAAADTPFASPVIRRGFVADDLGLGHVVVSARDKAESVAFYRDLLGFRLSDHIVCEFHGYPVDIDFFHANRRHHSVAVGGRQRKRIHHVMVEARDLDEVGLALDRTLKAGLRLRQTLGRHPNDRMLSFYADTPSGFQFELGWGGREVDDATWEPTTYDHISEWGHHPPGLLAARPPKPASTAAGPSTTKGGST